MYGGAGALIPFVVLIVVVAASAAATWKIVSKAGYAGALSLLAFVPVVNVVMMFVFAFSEWPVTRELRAAKAALGPPTSTLR